MSRIVVFDTETTSLEKPFVYNIGYVIYDTEENRKLVEHDFVVEQIWHNRELFTTAYYADKREGYVADMRARKVRMEKLGYITQFMAREFKDLEVEAAFAYNSPFDDKVFKYNCDWFKIINPFDNIPIYDIRGYVFRKIAYTNEYKEFCDKNEYFTDSGNYSTTAEVVYRFLTQNTDFIEDHSVQRIVSKRLELTDADGIKHNFPYNKITVYAEKDNRKRIVLKNLDRA